MSAADFNSNHVILTKIKFTLLFLVMWAVYFNEMEAVNHTLALGQPSSKDPVGAVKIQLLPNCNASRNKSEMYSFDSLEIHRRLDSNKGILNSQRGEGYKVDL